MMKILKRLTLVLLFFILVLELPTIKRESIAQSGTLIVVIPTREGLVICGDKRSHNEENGTISDTTIKVRRLDDSTVYLATGIVYRSHLGSFLGNFDLFAIVESWYQSHATTNLFSTETRVQEPPLSGLRFTINPNPWEDLKRQLENKLSSSRGYQFLNQTNSFFEILFLRINDTGEPVARGVVHPNGLFSSVLYGEPDNIDLKKAEPILLGSREVYIELKEGNSEVFNDLRANPFLKPFLGNWRLREEVTPNEALAFEHTIIEATNERGQKLNDKIHVSKECNCALLSYKMGFKWISTEDYPPPVIEPPKPQVKSNMKSKQKRQTRRRREQDRQIKKTTISTYQSLRASPLPRLS